MREIEELTEVLESLKKSVDSTMGAATTAKNKAQGDAVINQMYNKVLKIQDSISNDPNPVKRIKYMQELTDLINKI
jgi:hypothetical protein